MFVSAEIVAIVLSAVGIVLTLGTTMIAGFAWCVRRIDGVDAKHTARGDAMEGRLIARSDALEEKLTARIDSVEEKLTARIDSVEEKLTARIDSVEEKLTARIDLLANDVTELKVSVARIEGPTHHLIVPRH